MIQANNCPIGCQHDHHLNTELSAAHTDTHTQLSIILTHKPCTSSQTPRGDRAGYITDSTGSRTHTLITYIYIHVCFTNGVHAHAHTSHANKYTHLTQTCCLTWIMDWYGLRNPVAIATGGLPPLNSQISTVAYKKNSCSRCDCNNWGISA